MWLRILCWFLLLFAFHCIFTCVIYYTVRNPSLSTCTVVRAKLSISVIFSEPFELSSIFILLCQDLTSIYEFCSCRLACSRTSTCFFLLQLTVKCMCTGNPFWQMARCVCRLQVLQVFLRGRVPNFQWRLLGIHDSRFRGGRITKSYVVGVF